MPKFLQDNIVSIKTALISVSHREGLLPFVRFLQDEGIRLYATGGSGKWLTKNGISVSDISDLTHFPNSILDGRVKTLHPAVHGAILANRHDANHTKQLQEHHIGTIDLVIANLYPFVDVFTAIKKKRAENIHEKEIANLIENIDIGGVSLLRSAAKNYQHVVVATQPTDYDAIINEIKKDGGVSLTLRQRLSLQAFRQTARYDAFIDTALSELLLDEQVLHLEYKAGKKLRYGENPHQSARLYTNSSEISGSENIVDMKQLHGKEMSYNNYVDASSAFSVVQSALSTSELANSPMVVMVKHNNPCGMATGTTVERAMEMAWQGDVVSAFGSIIVSSHAVSYKDASFLQGKFVELILAPDYTSDALNFLRKKSSSLRILANSRSAAASDYQQKKMCDTFTASISKKGDGNSPQNKMCAFINGGLLQQTTNNALIENWCYVTKKKSTPNKKGLYCFTYLAVKFIKSNAIAIGYEYEKGYYMLLAMGCGQPNRVDSVRKLALEKAKENIERLYGKNRMLEIMGKCVLASDAFFPFSDNIEHGSAAGIRFYIQPGGSIRDNQVIEACNRYDAEMVFTDTRHFLH